jgi:hypothetical protein
VTTPGLGRPGGSPPLDRPANEAIEAARARAGIGQGPVFPFPQRLKLTDDERKEAQAAAKDACQLCGGIHAAPNSPACPRIRTFKLNPDGRVTEGEFWRDGEFDAKRILFVADALDDEKPGDEASDDAEHG